MISNRKILLLGSSGFIGKQFQKTFGNDIFPMGVREEKWGDFIPRDINVFINLVGKAHDHKGTATESDYYYANFELVKKIYEEFIKSNAELFIHLSSLAALEEFESKKPLTEEDSANPQSFYGKSKRAAEEWLLQQDLPQNKKIIILRPPMVHGVGDKGNLGLLYKFVSKGIPYPLSAFTNNRSFISIDNLSFFVKQIISNYSTLENGIYHVSDDSAISTDKIIQIIGSVENKKVKNIALPIFIVKSIARFGDFISFFPLNTKRLKKMTSSLTVSNQKIKSALGIEKLPLTAEQGLEITIKSFKK